MLLDPGVFRLQLVWKVAGDLELDLLQVVSELVVGDDEGIRLTCILDAVGVIVVLGRCLHHDSRIRHLVQHSHRVRQFGCLQTLLVHVQVQLQLFLLLIDLFVVEEILWEEADDFVAVFHPVLNRDLDASA